MPGSAERTPHERETLIFAQPEAADQFREAVGEQLRATDPATERQRQAVADAVAEQFAQAGETVDLVREPWEHTREEHEEAQSLVDIAFAQDLPAAIRKARVSPHYPRNLDLFHDVLTSEMYQLVREHRVHAQPLTVAILASLLITAVTVFLVLLVIVLSR